MPYSNCLIKTRYALIFLFHALSVLALQSQTEIKVQDNAKVGNIVTGKGNTLNINQTFNYSKSQEWNEKKSSLDRKDKETKSKAQECAQLANIDAVPVEIKDNCRKNLIRLNLEKDSLQKDMERYQDDIVRLAQLFDTISITSERLEMAKKLFSEGNFSGANAIINVADIFKEGDKLIERKEKIQTEIKEINKGLTIRSQELMIKAELVAMNTRFSTRYDSVEYFYVKALQYAERGDNLHLVAENSYRFGSILDRNKRTNKAIEYYAKALSLLKDNEPLKVEILLNYADAFRALNEYDAAIETYKQVESSLDSNIFKFKRDYLKIIAKLHSGLGIVYQYQKRPVEAEENYRKAYVIYDLLSKDTLEKIIIQSTKADMLWYLGSLFFDNRSLNLIDTTLGKADTLFNASYKIFMEIYKKEANEKTRERIAIILANRGIIYQELGKKIEGLELLLQAKTLYDTLVKNNPDTYEATFSTVLVNLGLTYRDMEKYDDAEKMFIECLKIRKVLAKENPKQFGGYLEYALYEYCTQVITQGNLTKGKDLLKETLSTHKDLINNDVEPYLKTENLPGLFYLLLDSLMQHEEWQTITEVMELFVSELKDSIFQLPNDLFAENYGSLSWYYLLTNELEKAEQAGNEALNLDGTLNYVKSNLAHSFLLRNDIKQAKMYYEAYLIGEPDKEGAKVTLAQDFQLLQQHGYPAQVFKKVRYLQKK